MKKPKTPSRKQVEPNSAASINVDEQLQLNTNIISTHQSKNTTTTSSSTEPEDSPIAREPPTSPTKPDVPDEDLRTYFTRQSVTEPVDIIPPRLLVADNFRKLDISVNEIEPRYVNISNNIPIEQLPTFQELFQEYRDIFAYTYCELLGVHPSRCQHRIPLRADARPYLAKPYRLNPQFGVLVRKELDKLLECNFIYPSEESEWASPILVVPKKDTGKIRICVDFRVLNQQTIPDPFPIPFTDMLLDEVVGSELFSFMDVFSGYNRIAIAPEDQHKTTFVTPWGTFAYRVMPFGLQNAPATFQRYMMNSFIPLNATFKLYLDDLSTGSVLSQLDETNKDHPIYYASRQLSKAERNYGATELECIGMILSVQKFRHYLLGTTFVFFVDHQALRYIVNRPSRSEKLARWMLLLQEFNFTVEYKPGKSHVNADFLSRLPGEPSLTALDMNPIGFSLFAITTQAPWTDQLRHYLTTGQTPSDLPRRHINTFHINALHFTVIKDTLYRMGPDHILCRCLEHGEIPTVLKASHADEAGGHFSSELTSRKGYLSGYWWPSVHKDCDTFVKRCDACQRQGRPVSRYASLLSLMLATRPFQKWRIDFIGPINPPSRSTRHKYIIVATDYVTKWTEAASFTSAKAAVTIQFLHNNIISQFGVPITIISDNGTHFVNDAVAELAESYGIEHRRSTPYHPQTNGTNVPMAY
ncbi:hypothetical protein R1sor_008995 [Riccia sorocarpa]|uniref:Integrase catalytic domain-containing protein n=1 Tax=Riccia sorocarpa TaxID=122646 RepID=A0ABD3H6F2_9MARC